MEFLEVIVEKKEVSHEKVGLFTLKSRTFYLKKSGCLPQKVGLFYTKGQASQPLYQASQRKAQALQP